MENKYWIIFGIVFIALLWTIRKKNDSMKLEGFEDLEEEDARIENAQVKLTSLLGLLLDNQGFSNQIIIDHKLTSIRDLVEKNRKKISLNLKPILDNNQYRIANRYLLLNDIYFTSGKTKIEQDDTKIITFARQTEFVKPKELYGDMNMEDLELNSFREQYHMNKNMYLQYQWIYDKVKNYVNMYGLSMVTMSMDNMKEVFEKNYWEGSKYLSKSDLFDIPIYTLLYLQETEELFYKLADNKWFVTTVEKDNNINLLLKNIKDPIKSFNYWKNLNNQETNYSSNMLPSGEYFWIRSTSTFDLARLYRKIDEMSQNNFFSLNPVYDQLIKLPLNLEPVYTQLQRMTLFKKWIETTTDNPEEQKMLIENIIIDMNHRVINICDDISTYLIFYQHEDFAELYLDKYIRPQTTLGNWWSASNFDAILVKGTLLGQCVLPASFGINKIQEAPPIYKFIYNRNLYHTFWQPLEIYINDLEKYINTKFKTTVVEEIAPIARFCIFNNPSLRLYLSKYVACNSDSCNTTLTNMKEPERCGALKLKYQDLMNKKMKLQCFYRSKTDMNPTSSKIKDSKNANTTDDNKINQMFGFANLLLLNIIEYSLKLHLCQTERIEIKDCQSLLNVIDTNDQKDDLKLNVVAVDRQSDLYSNYDKQLNDYNKILNDQEKKQLEPLNQLANIDEEKKKQNVDMISKSADDFYSIINDLTNLTKYGESGQYQVEEFDNQLNDNMDLSEKSMGAYRDRLEKQIRGMVPNETGSMLSNTKIYFYNLFDILTKDGRIMTSGVLFLIIAFGLYFIDISS
jgi:hypothetical protein